MAVIVENLIVMDEKYFDYVKNDVQGYKGTFEIYKNPSETEIKKYIDKGDARRGFIDRYGNLYVVGWDEDNYTNVEYKDPIHINLIKAIYEKDPYVFNGVDPLLHRTASQMYDEFETEYWIAKYGLNVAFKKGSIFLGESNYPMMVMEQVPELINIIKELYRKCAEKNPSLKFKLVSI